MQSQAAILKQHEQVQAPSCIPLEHTEVATQQQHRFSDIPEVKKFESRERLELPDLNLPLEDGGPDISCAAAWESSSSRGMMLHSYWSELTD